MGGIDLWLSDELSDYRDTQPRTSVNDDGL